MNCEWSIERVEAVETYPLRQRILRPGRPPEDAVFAGDGDADTIHIALRLNGNITGVVSLFRRAHHEATDTEAYQLRGMAMDAGFRGLGLGTQLMLSSVSHVLDRKGGRIWCNARMGAVRFYALHGFRAVGEEFDIAGIGPHRMMVLELKAGRREG